MLEVNKALTLGDGMKYQFKKWCILNLEAIDVGELPEGISYACNLLDYIVLGFGSSYTQLTVERNVSYVFLYVLSNKEPTSL